MSDPYDGLSTDPNVAGILGENTAGGPGVSGRGTPAGDFESAAGDGVYATSSSPQHCGVAAANDSGGTGVYARGSPGGAFESPSSDGVYAVSHDAQHGGVVGVNDGGGWGVYGQSNSAIHPAVVGENTAGGAGVEARSTVGNGVYAVSHDAQHAGVFGVNDNGGIGVYGKATQAGVFEGNVTVTGDVILTGADCAEEFDITEAGDIEPGTVMVINQDGTLQPSRQAYDKRVAGVISGAGDYKPGIILDKQQIGASRVPIALVGKVYCKVDAQHTPIEVGDLLTTSSTLGYAMKADDPTKAFGTVIGKALRSMEAGQGMIPILIALQ